MITSENQLFLYLKKNIPDLEKATDKFSTYDFLSEERESIFEVKVRKVHYDDLVLERGKYERLLEVALNLDKIPWYINSTPEGVYAFNLEVVNTPEWSKRKMPKTSHFSNREKIEKEVGYLSTCSAIII